MAPQLAHLARAMMVTRLLTDPRYADPTARDAYKTSAFTPLLELAAACEGRIPVDQAGHPAVSPDYLTAVIGSRRLLSEAASSFTLFCPSCISWRWYFWS